jgi:hypothetical protein
MSFTAEGTIEIELGEFFNWVYSNYAPCKGAEFQYGVPRINKGNVTMEIDFAMATECHPKEWIEKPDVCKQWNELE